MLSAPELRCQCLWADLNWRWALSNRAMAGRRGALASSRGQPDASNAARATELIGAFCGAVCLRTGQLGPAMCWRVRDQDSIEAGDGSR
jgi:hypothetical protein